MNTALLATMNMRVQNFLNTIIIVHNLWNYIIVEMPARGRKAKAKRIICKHIIQ